MFGFIKNLWSRRSEPAPPPDSPTSPVAEPPPPAAPSEPPAPAVPAGTQAPSVSVSLANVISRLPESLRPRVNKPPATATRITVPLDRVLPQLAQGVVKLSFGDLRRLAPGDTFTKLANLDTTPVELPLQELLSQIPPDQLPTRGTRRKVQLPSNLPSVFVPTQATGTGARMVAAPEYKEPLAAVESPAPTVQPIRPPPPTPAHFKPGGLPTSGPVTFVRPAAAGPVPLPAVAPAPAPKLPTTTPPAALRLPGTLPAPTVVGGAIIVSLPTLSGAWPDAARRAVESAIPRESVVALPLARMEEGLRAGKLNFPWQEIRSWIKPTPTTEPAVGLNDSELLSLPIALIAPLFLAQQQPATTRRTVDVGDNIPDVFRSTAAAPQAVKPVSRPAPGPAETPALKASALPAPASVPAPAPAAPTPAPAFSAVAPAPASSVEADALVASLAQRHFTPTEIVQKTCALPGVTGVVIALSDGLQVASQLPLGLNGDTVAAFVPQMFSRLANYAKELNWPEPKQVTVAFDGVPVLIIKAGMLFFIVLGREGVALPLSPLAAIAAHLAR